MAADLQRHHDTTTARNLDSHATDRDVGRLGGEPVVDGWTALRTAGELVANMGPSDLHRRSITNTTPLGFKVVTSDAAQHIQARELRFPDQILPDEADSNLIVKAALEDKALV